MSLTSKSCCPLAEKLGPQRLADLDAELARPDHRGLKALAKEFGVPREEMERHKRECVLPILRPKREESPPEPASPPAAEPSSDKPARSGETRARAGLRPRPPARKGGEDESKGVGEPKSIADLEPDPGDHDSRARFIAGKILDNEWDTKSIVDYAERWGMHVRTVQESTRDAAMLLHVKPEEIEQRRAIALARREAAIRKAWNELQAGAEFPDTISKLLDAYERQLTGWERAAGLYDDAPKVILNDPKFVAAAKQYVDTVQTVLYSADALAERVAARLGAAVPREIIAAVLAEADVLIAERVEGRASAAAPPVLVGGAR